MPCVGFIVLLLVNTLYRSGDGAAAAAAAVAEPEPEPEPELYPLKVFFGSQTGTAEGFAQRVVDDAKKHGFEAEAVDLEDFEVDELPDTKLAVFMMATYGEGDPTDNAIDFVSHIKDKEQELEEDHLSDVQYCVFGLGNTQYEHYNSMGRLVNKRMKELGATPVYQYGEGDDDGTMEDDFDGWYDDLWTGLRRDVLGDETAVVGAGGGDGAGDGDGVVAPELKYRAVMMDAAPRTAAQVESARKRLRAGSEGGSSIAVQSRHFFTAVPVRVVENRELRQSTAAGSTVHVEVAAPPGGYTTADNLAVCPENEAATVEAVAKWLGYDLEAWFVLEPRDSNSGNNDLKPLYPTPCSVREALTCYADLQGIPSRRFLGTLAHYSTSDKDKARLAHLASKAGKGEAATWLVQDQKSLVEVLQAFPSIEIPLGDFMEVVPRLQPRWYTIASSSTAKPDAIGLTVSVVVDAKPQGREHRGVCSNFLARLQTDPRAAAKALRPGDAPELARVFIQPSTFRLPADPGTPIVMVGPGSGVAPMRAFCQERAHQQAGGAKLGEALLFFGCRRPDEDFIYKDELEAWHAAGVVTDLVTAFSRSGPSKVYVQHRMRDRAADIWRIMGQQGGHFYVCGGTSMGKDVQAELERIATDDGGELNQ